jgi:hypothetical protein
LRQRLEKVGDGVDRLATINIKSASAPGGATRLPFVAVAFLPFWVEKRATEFETAEGIVLRGMRRVVIREGNWHGKS